MQLKPDNSIVKMIRNISSQRAGVIIEMTLSVSVFLMAIFGILDFGGSLREQYALSDGVAILSREISIPAEIEICGNMIRNADLTSEYCQNGDLASSADLVNQPVFCEYGRIESSRNTAEACKDPSISVVNFIEATKLNVVDWLSTNGFNPDHFAVTLKLTSVVYESNNSDSYLYLAIKRIVPHKITLLNIALKNCAEIMVKINITNPEAQDSDQQSYFIKVGDLISACA